MLISFLLGWTIAYYSYKKLVNSQKTLINKQCDTLEKMDKLNSDIIKEKTMIEIEYHKKHNDFLHAMTYIKPLEKEIEMITDPIKIDHSKEIFDTKELTIDEILDKINKNGMLSLTEEKKKLGINNKKK